MLKKIGAIAGCIFVTSTAIAGGYSANHQSDSRSGIFAGVNGGWFQQSNDGTSYTVLDRSASSVSTGPVELINTKYHFSGGGKVGYLFNNNVDVEFSFFIHDHSDNNSVTAGSGEHVDTVLLPADWGFDFANSASSKYSYKSNQFSFLLGYLFRLSQRFNIHPFFGLTVVDLSGNQETTYTGLNGGSNNATVFKNTSSVAVGSTFGVSANYNVWKSIGLFWNGAVSVLANDLKSSYRTTNTAGITNADISNDNGESLASLLQSKLGAFYKFHIKNMPAEMAIGYQFTNYINVGASHSLPDDVAEGLTTTNYNNTGFSGPFLSLSVNT